MSINLRRLLMLALPAFLVLPGCSSLGGAAASMVQAMYEQSNPQGYQNQPLKEFTYLEVHAPNSTALLVLAEADASSNNTAVVETWVGASNEVLRTQAGFVVGSAGVDQLWQQASLSTQGNGQPESLLVDAPGLGIYNTVLNLQPVDLRTVKLANTPLLKRARTVPGLVERGWLGQPTGVAVNSHVAKLNGTFQMVATHPQTGALVYGQHCSTPSYCIEFLVRTPAQNL